MLRQRHRGRRARVSAGLAGGAAVPGRGLPLRSPQPGVLPLHHPRPDAREPLLLRHHGRGEPLGGPTKTRWCHLGGPLGLGGAHWGAPLELGGTAPAPVSPTVNNFQSINFYTQHKDAWKRSTGLVAYTNNQSGPVSPVGPVGPVSPVSPVGPANDYC